MRGYQLVDGPAAVDYQAEDAFISQGVVESNHTGFSGTGFVNYDNVSGSFVEWTVPASTAGPASLALRYANGTTLNRPMDMTVNGMAVSAAHPFNPTGAWSSWAMATLTVPLTAGPNRIRATATTANGGPNVDKITVS
ncbi:carbohydrate-binding protein [Streptomyces sp. HC307]|uniref:carbohydrate-binding protein n=1 Tax=Streptomyces flavusporus TaxID=3385496 RepID=UPI003917346F